MKKTIRCANMNHGKLNAPVRNCPMCGIVVNKVIRTHCDDTKHAARRKDRNAFCCDCGKKLITP
ncbi:MAG: hypothetical protein ACXVCP_14570 [Bdellovibrio sp.]